MVTRQSARLEVDKREVSQSGQTGVGSQASQVFLVHNYSISLH
jgi:hypothetical protein